VSYVNGPYTLMVHKTYGVNKLAKFRMILGPISVKFGVAW